MLHHHELISTRTEQAAYLRIQQLVGNSGSMGKSFSHFPRRPLAAGDFAQDLRNPRFGDLDFPIREPT